MAEKEEDQTEDKKLPYFHRQLSKEDSKLIGDITPKPISQAEARQVEADGAKQGSAWNAAQSWEEKDCSKWAHVELESVFGSALEVQAIATPHTVTLESISDINSSAQKTHVRGKARYMYEFSFDLDFTVINSDSGAVFNGKLKVSDVINDQLDDMELDISWTGDRPASQEMTLLRKLLLGKLIKDALKVRMAIFEERYKEK